MTTVARTSRLVKPRLLFDQFKKVASFSFLLTSPPNSRPLRMSGCVEVTVADQMPAWVEGGDEGGGEMSAAADLAKVWMHC
jgi:hypothetical protein